ncbi:MAG TPA: oligoendopeptidase F, partial [Thermoanaerobaculia bacterium]|nr:oligoendopeptidase F [Thermoanaerobaculia bacterium]
MRRQPPLQPLLPAAGAGAATLAPPHGLARAQIGERYRWDLKQIFPGWSEWEEACADFARQVEEYAALQGTLAQGAASLVAALERHDRLGELAHRVWYYPSLMYDEDQRDNAINARRQRVQVLFARWEQAAAWFKPELLAIPLDAVRRWMDAEPRLAHFRFRVEDLFRVRGHVLGEEGERILSFTSRFAELPDDAYAALSTADVRWPTLTLPSGASVTVSYGQYRKILATNRSQPDRAAVFQAFYRTFDSTLNTYAALYNGVCQRDWFGAMARRYPTTLEAALDGNDIPTRVVEQLIATTREGVAPLQRYHRLRRRALGLEEYHLYDSSIPLVDEDLRYPYDEAVRLVLESARPLGEEYVARMRNAFSGRYVDVYENEGKRSGAYSAGVYGVHPFLLLNYNDTLDDLFTLAHEMGHALHTLLSHETQPFTYASYTIFVAEVASTLNEALLLETLLARTGDPRQRAMLLQHAIDSVAGTFYTQVLFAEWELTAHRLAERGEPITAEILCERYLELLRHYYGDSVTVDDLYRITWARIPHFFQSPYYVYQYATSFAASAQLARELRTAESARDRQGVVDRYLRLLRAGG